MVSVQQMIDRVNQVLSVVVQKEDARLECGTRLLGQLQEATRLTILGSVTALDEPIGQSMVVAGCSIDPRRETVVEVLDHLQSAIGLASISGAGDRGVGGCLLQTAFVVVEQAFQRVQRHVLAAGTNLGKGAFEFFDKVQSEFAQTSVRLGVVVQSHTVIVHVLDLDHLLAKFGGLVQDVGLDTVYQAGGALQLHVDRQGQLGI